MKRFILLILLAGVMIGQSPSTIADISGDGSAHQIAATGSARLILFQAGAGNSATNCTGNTLSGCVRIGDSTVSGSRGIYLVPGASAMLPESAGASRYQLSQWYYLVQTGDKLTITYVQ